MVPIPLESVIRSNQADIFDLPELPTPLNRSLLIRLLEFYPDRTAAKFLSRSFRKGFILPIDPEDAQFNTSLPPQTFSADDASILRGLIDKELLNGRLAGPFSTAPWKQFALSPIHVVPKKEHGKYRMIHNLSYSGNFSSVNACISDSDAAVYYVKFDSIVERIRSLGQGGKLFKFDISSAFKLLPVHPSQYCLLGFQFENQLYFDRTLSFGLRCSCALWELFATFLEWLFKEISRSDDLDHYLDDFIGCGNDSENLEPRVNKLLWCCDKLGIPVAEEKTVLPTTSLVALGINIDTVQGVIALPQEKMTQLLDLINEALTKKKMSLKGVQRLLGSLNFACRVFFMARPFLRRLYKFLSVFKSQYHKHRLPKECKEDLRMWKIFLEDGIGRRQIFIGGVLENPHINLYTDASSWGFGIVFQKEWISQPWGNHFAKEVSENNIAFLELFPIVLSLCIWKTSLSNMRICFLCDNAAVVDVINSRSAKDTKLSALLRKLVLICLRCNIAIHAVHLPGSINHAADALSRGAISLFHLYHPSANTTQTYFPKHLLKLI